MLHKKTISLYPSHYIKPFNINLAPYPELPTDLGPLLCVLASQINGETIIKDTVYKERKSHIQELNKMNVNIKYINDTIIIKGKNNIINKHVNAKDLRCGAALVITSSLCNKYTTIHNIQNVFRGYENIKEKLNSLGIEFII